MPVQMALSVDHWLDLPTLQRHVNNTNLADEAELELHRDAAEDAVEALVGAIKWRTVTETQTARGGWVALRVLPVRSVTSVTRDAVATTYDADVTAGVLQNVGSSSAVTITYEVGRAVVPDAIVLATAIIAGNLWESQRGNAPSALPVDDFDPEFITAAGTGGYAIPRRASQLLAPYLLLPGF